MYNYFKSKFLVNFRNEKNRHFLWLFIDKITVLGLSFLFITFLAKQFGPKTLGIWSYVLSIIAIASILSTLGLRGILIRELVLGKKNKGSLLGTSFILAFIGGCIAVIVSIISIQVLNLRETGVKELLIILSLKFVFSAFEIFTYYFETTKNYKNIAIASIAASLLTFPIKIYLIYNNYSLTTIGYFVVAESFIRAALLYLFYISSKAGLKWTFNKLILVKLLKDGYPLILSSFLAIVYMKSDQIMLGKLSTVTEVGYYAISSRLLEVWFFVPMIYNSINYPKLVELYKNDRAKFELEYLKYFRLVVLFSYGIIILYYLFSGTIIRLLFGVDYEPAITTIKILCFALIFVSLETGRIILINLENITNYQFYTISIGVILNLLLNFILIPKFGANGAAIASVIAQFISVVLLCLAFKKLNNVGKIMLKTLVFPFKKI